MVRNGATILIKGKQEDKVNPFEATTKKSSRWVTVACHEGLGRSDVACPAARREADYASATAAVCAFDEVASCRQLVRGLVIRAICLFVKSLTNELQGLVRMRC